MSYHTLILIFFVLLGTSITHGIQQFTTNGQEFIYDYTGFFKAGALVPVSYASECYLKAKLHVQNIDITNIDQIGVYAKLTDLKYGLFNGPRYHTHEQDVKMQLAVEEINADLLKPFKIYYNQLGGTYAVATDATENNNARNMHKAIASMLQLNLGFYTIAETKTFEIEENTVFGTIPVTYTPFTEGNNVIIKKIAKIDAHMYDNVFSNIESNGCDEPMEEFISPYYHQNFIIEKGEKLLVKQIQSTGGVYFYPFLFQSQGQYVYVNVTLNFLESKPIERHFEGNFSHIDLDLTHKIIDQSLEPTFNIQKKIAILQTMLIETQEYLQHDVVGTVQAPDLYYSQVINRMVQYLTGIDLNGLEKIQQSTNKLRNKQYIDTFYRTLPFVGTHASLVMIKNIICEGKIEEELAIELLQSLPQYVRVPTTKMAKDLDGLLNLDHHVSMNVKKAAILSFSSLIKKISKQQGDVDGVFKEYVKNFTENAQSTNDTATKLLYIQALHNTKLQSAVESLLSIMKDSNYDMRLVILYSLGEMLQYGNPHKLTDIYWTIFADRTQNSEMRMLAFHFFMRSKPSSSRLHDMFWIMTSERFTDLYDFYYSYLYALAESTNRCLSSVKTNTARYLKFTPKPIIPSLSKYYQINYIDDQYKFGSDLTTMLIATDRVIMFQFAINREKLNVAYNYYKFFVKVHGLNQADVKKVIFSIKHTNFRATILKLLASARTNAGIQIHVSVTSQNQIYETHYYDAENIEELANLFRYFTNDATRKSIKIQYDAITHISIPTPIGIPALIDILDPTVFHIHRNITKSVVDDKIYVSIDNRYHISKDTSYEVYFHNPIVNIWQGSGRYISYNLVVPLFVDVEIHDDNLKVSLKKKNGGMEYVGLNGHTTTYTFVLGDQHGILQTSCEECQDWSHVSRGADFRHNYTILDGTIKNIGYKYFGTFYDSEEPITSARINEFVNKLTEKTTKSYKTPLEYLVLILGNLHKHSILQLLPFTHGIVLRASPADLMTQTDFAFSFKSFDQAITTIDREYLRGMELEANASCSVKNNKDTIRSWNVNAKFHINPGHTNRKTHLTITRLIPVNEKLTITYEGVKNWTTTNANGHSKFVIEDSTDAKSEISIEFLAEQLEQQKNPSHKYGMCESYSHKFGADYFSLQCAAQHTSLRKYTYDITTKNISNLAEFGLKQLMSWYPSYFRERINDNNEGNLGENNIKMIREYTMDCYEANIKIVTPTKIYELLGMSTKDSNFLYPPDNTHFSRLYSILHASGVSSTCIIADNHVIRDGAKIEKELPGEWTLYLGDLENNLTKNAVFLKKEGEKLMALKAVYDTHSLEIHPNRQVFNISLDGKIITDKIDYRAEDWFTYVIRPYVHGVILNIYRLQLIIVYTDEQAIISIPYNIADQLHGICIAEEIVETGTEIILKD